MSRNCTHVIVFPNVADALSIECISRNVFTKPKFITKCLKWLQANLPNGENFYCFINVHPRSHLHESYRISYNIFPEEDGQKRVIFLFKKE